NEGAKFWLNVLTELKNRGLNDILIASVDGLKGFPDAINTVYPKARIQLCPLNRPDFPGECFICELRLPDHCFR
ncbi:transposase, partial [Escherichia coli]